MSSRTTAVAVAVSAISGMSNLRNFNLSALKFSLKTDNRLKMHEKLCQKIILTLTSKSSKLHHIVLGTFPRFPRSEYNSTHLFKTDQILKYLY